MLRILTSLELKCVECVSWFWFWLWFWFWFGLFLFVCGFVFVCEGVFLLVCWVFVWGFCFWGFCFSFSLKNLNCCFCFCFSFSPGILNCRNSFWLIKPLFPKVLARKHVSQSVPLRPNAYFFAGSLRSLLGIFGIVIEKQARHIPLLGTILSTYLLIHLIPWKNL